MALNTKVESVYGGKYDNLMIKGLILRCESLQTVLNS